MSNDDASALDAFCSDLSYEEIPFESWQQTLENLDLHVPLWVLPEGALSGGEQAVHFCRTVREREGASPTRQVTSCLITLPAAAKNGQHLVIPGQGDRIASRTGDLIVIIKIKPSTSPQPR